MPKKSRKQLACIDNVNFRYGKLQKDKTSSNITTLTENSNQSIDTDDSLSNASDEYDYNNNVIYQSVFTSVETQTDDLKRKTTSDKSTQTPFNITDISSNFECEIIQKIDITKISGLVDILRDKCETWNAIHERILSVIFYMILRLCKIKYDYVSNLLANLNLFHIATAHNWCESLVEENDLMLILKDDRGKYERVEFYDIFPEIEKEAKSFAIQNACKKEATFCVKNLANFVTRQYEEASGDKLGEGDVIRSESSCRVDLIKWGAKWDSNKNRPYFEGHERPDVVEAKEKYIN